MTFDDVISILLKREGGYVNNPADRGGPTNFGITQSTLNEYGNRHGWGYRDVRAINQQDAAAIYREKYWTPAKCDLLPDAVRDIHFDSAVNHGVQRAAYLLQESVGVTEDGSIGPATLAAVASMSADLLRARYRAARYRFYGRIIYRDRSQLQFIAGWLHRMEDFA